MGTGVRRSHPTASQWPALARAGIKITAMFSTLKLSTKTTRGEENFSRGSVGAAESSSNLSCGQPGTRTYPIFNLFPDDLGRIADAFDEAAGVTADALRTVAPLRAVSSQLFHRTKKNAVTCGLMVPSVRFELTLRS